MKNPNGLRGQAMAIMRGLKRAAVSKSEHAEARFPGGRLRALRHSGEEGQSAVEFALMLPMLMVIITGILIFGIYEMQILALTEGVSNAGRVLAVSAGQTLDPCATAVTAVTGAAAVLNPANLSYIITLNPVAGNLAVNNHSYPQASCLSANITSPPSSYMVSGGTVTVKATFNACSLQFYGNNLAPGGCSISQSITEVVQ
jgi:Flp pilus assembly protein TadG